MDSRCVRAWLSFGIGCFVAMSIGDSERLRAQEPDGALARSNRVVHHFDFDERALGNLEDVPKYWVPIRPRGFPRFAHGEFDSEVGHLAPPSFYLSSEGRNVAYHYSGPETRVRPNTAYRIDGFIRGNRLRRTRACLSAHFLNADREPIPGTLVRTRYVQGSDKANGWVRVEIQLPDAPPEAFSVGIAAWVMQESMWNTAPPPKRHIRGVDVHSGAWFDDIMLYALPRARIATGAAGNVLGPDDVAELLVTLGDDEDTELTGIVSIIAADGGLVESHSVPVVVGAVAPPMRIPLARLSPGLYHARLDAFTQGTRILSRRLTFARLGPLHHESRGGARAFGVVVDPQSRSEPDTELALLRQQFVRSAKLPIWTGLVEDPSTSAQRRATTRLLQELVKDGFALTGVFVGPPSEIVLKDGAYPRPLLDLLNAAPSEWQQYLAAVVAPNASAFRWWQVGPDGRESTADRDQLERAVEQLRVAMRRFITMPLLGLPVVTTVETRPTKLPVQQLSVTIGHETQTSQFDEQVGRFKTLGYDHVASFVPSLPADRYHRIPRLASWAQRLITARHVGMDTVFAPATWRTRNTSRGLQTEPTEEFILLRTIADVIGDAVPGPRLRISPTVECLAFHYGDKSVLALWDAQAPPEGRTYAIQLGRATRQIDLWGRATSLGHDKRGRHLVRLSPMPTLVDGVERWLMDFRSSVAITPRHVESGAELGVHTMELSHKGRQPISGTMRLTPPKSWEITPRVRTFNLMPQRTLQYAVKTTYPHNEPAGNKKIVARFTLRDGPYDLEVPLTIEVGLSDVDVWGMAVVEGDDLVIRHVVTNRSEDVLHFLGAATVPGRQRQYRPLYELNPGDTQTVEYRFANGKSLIGAAVRVGLREMNDGPRRHSLELFVP